MVTHSLATARGLKILVAGTRPLQMISSRLKFDWFDLLSQISTKSAFRFIRVVHTSTGLTLLQDHPSSGYPGHGLVRRRGFGSGSFHPRRFPLWTIPPDERNMVQSRQIGWTRNTTAD